MFAWKKLLKEEGSFPMLAIIMVGLLIFTGLAYMKWGADESREAMYEKYKLQAYYAAHAGIMDIGFSYLRQLEPSTLAPEARPLGGETITNNAGNAVAIVENVWIQPRFNEGGTGLADFNYVDLSAVGRVDFKDYNNENATIRDSLHMTIKLLNLSNFLYLTNIETTIFGEVIKFWSQDTLDGWVHSNDTIAIMQSPVFYDHVSTTAPVFWQGPGYDPIFVNYPPMFEYREIQLPTEATEIRNAAAAAGLFFTDNNGQMGSRLVFNDDLGWTLYQWPLGTPQADTAVASGPPPNWQAIFVDGYLELQGVVRGSVTVGASGGFQEWIRLKDDIRYWASDPVTGDFDSTISDILGVVSEGDIVIANTPANGRDNSSYGPDSTDIIITGALIALGESFTFEDQNDVNPWEFSTGYSGPTPDDRGDIVLRGAITQYRRGYVHRSNHQSTGYGKDYSFDQRLNTMSPPYFIEATDAEGNAQFEIVSWGNR